MKENTVPDRLQALITKVREATLTESDRIPLDTFLANLRQETAQSSKKLSQDAQAAIYGTFPSVLNSAATTPTDVNLVSNSTQTFPTSTSRAVQTDSATISLWDVVPRAREEGYERGFREGINAGHKSGIEEGRNMNTSDQTFPTTASHAVQTDSATISLWDVVPRAREEGYERGFREGINAGHKSGIEEGRNMNMSEALSIGFEQGKDEGFKMAQEEHKVREQERTIVLARESSYEATVLKDERGVNGVVEKMDQYCVSKYIVDEKAASNGVTMKDPPTISTTVVHDKAASNSVISTAIVDGKVASNGVKLRQSQPASTTVAEDKVASNGTTVKRSPTLPTAMPSKEKKVKPMSNGADPFATLVPLARKK